MLPRKAETEPAARSKRGLIAFWAVVLASLGAGASYLQYLGPPPMAAAAIPAAPRLSSTSQHPAAPLLATPVADEVVVAAGIGTRSVLPSGAPIPLPSPGLLAASAINPQWQEPHIASDGTAPMQLYAASLAPPANVPLLPPGVPRIAVIVAGLGDDDQTGLLSATALPPEVSLALLPLGKHLDEISAAARVNGHETLLVLPMPMLLVKAPTTQNQTTLDWSMAQLQGYAGVTDAFGPAMGGGFLADPVAKNWLMDDIARKGLFYIEGDPGAPTAPATAGRNADIVIDAATDNVAAKLSALVADAELQHSALGIMLDPTPDALHTLDGWSRLLVNQDILLVPVSALVMPPETGSPIATSSKQ